MFENGMEVDSIAIVKPDQSVEKYVVGEQDIINIMVWESSTYPIFQLTYENGSCDVGMGFTLLAHKNAPKEETTEEPKVDTPVDETHV